jgi:hypothetical protein
MTTTIIDPVAQTFIIDGNNYPNGAFLSSICLFFRTKPTTNIPVNLSIVPTLNGYPNGTSLDYSVVSLPATSVVASTISTTNTSTESPHYKDPASWTKFSFSAPVYINPNVLYAFVVQSSSSDYTMWSAKQSDFALLSTSKALSTDLPPTVPTKISKSPYVGDLFESQNALTWTADLTQDLMFVINRCKFTSDVSTIPFVVPAGLPQRKTIETNMATATSNSTYDALNVSTTDFTPPGTAITYQYTTTLNSGLTDGPNSIIPGKYGTPKSTDVYLNDNKLSRVLDYSSNNSFILEATLSTTDDTVSPVISEDGLALYTTRYRINNMGISNNDIILVNGGIGYLSNANGTISSPSISVSSPDATWGSQAYVSANVYMGNIVSVYVTTEGAGYLTTPTVTITATANSNSVVQINGETSKSGGNGYARYLTQPITLSEGNDSGDLRVFFSAYRPVNTEISVYYKIVSREDTQKIDDCNWQLMTLVNGSSAYSTSMANIIEYEAAPGVNNVANNSVSYVSGVNGFSYTSFYQYMIKIVMSSSDSTFSPFLKDMRTIALPSGTGL